MSEHTFHLGGPLETTEAKIYRELGTMPGESLTEVLSGPYSFLHLWLGVPSMSEVVFDDPDATRPIGMIDEEALQDPSSIAHYLATAGRETASGV